MLPDPTTRYPVANTQTVCYIKPLIKNPNIIVGDFTYYSDDEAPEDFEKHVTHFYPFYDDKLIIGKFCQIAKGVEFIMNGANHKMKAFSTYPFYIFAGWQQEAPPLSDLPCKGDTVIGNDVWIGQNATILPGVHIGDGAIIGANSVVGSDVEAYTIVVGNPARPVRRRFTPEVIAVLLELKWWDWPLEKIKAHLDILSHDDVTQLKHLLIRKQKTEDR